MFNIDKLFNLSGALGNMDKPSPKITGQSLFELLETLDALDYPLTTPWGEQLIVTVDEVNQRVLVSIQSTLLEK